MLLLPDPPQQSPYPHDETPDKEDNPFQEYWPPKQPREVVPRPDFRPHDEIPGGAGGGMSEKDLLKLIWWLINQNEWGRFLDNNWLGRRGAGLPEPPSDECRADPVCYQEYIDSLWQWLIDNLGDTYNDFMDEYQDWLNDNPDGNFWDWLQQQDWWPF